MTNIKTISNSSLPKPGSTSSIYDTYKKLLESKDDNLDDNISYDGGNILYDMPYMGDKVLYADKKVFTIFQFKRGSSARWEELNLVLAEGEPGFELDTGRAKIGDGVTPWRELAYLTENEMIKIPMANVVGLPEFIDTLNGDATVPGSIENRIEPIRQTAQVASEFAQAANDLAEEVQQEVKDLIGVDVDKTIREIANEELVKQLIPEGAIESLDTLTEISNWIQQHPEDAAKMNAQISENQKAIEKLEASDIAQEMEIANIKATIGTGAAGETNTLIARINKVEKESKDYTDQEIKKVKDIVESNQAVLITRLNTLDTTVQEATTLAQQTSKRLEEETARSVAQDTALATSLAAEVARAKQAEEENHTLINDLKKKALIAEAKQNGDWTLKQGEQDLNFILKCGDGNTILWS